MSRKYHYEYGIFMYGSCVNHWRSENLAHQDKQFYERLRGCKVSVKKVRIYD